VNGALAAPIGVPSSLNSVPTKFAPAPPWPSTSVMAWPSGHQLDPEVGDARVAQRRDPYAKVLMRPAAEGRSSWTTVGVPSLAMAAVLPAPGPSTARVPRSGR
jgi:hypothetical protein